MELQTENGKKKVPLSTGLKWLRLVCMAVVFGIIAGGVMPVHKSVELVGCKELASDTFLERREMGVINIGGKGRITVYAIDPSGCTLVGDVHLPG